MVAVVVVKVKLFYKTGNLLLRSLCLFVGTKSISQPLKLSHVGPFVFGVVDCYFYVMYPNQSTHNLLTFPFYSYGSILALIECLHRWTSPCFLGSTLITLESPSRGT